MKEKVQVEGMNYSEIHEVLLKAVDPFKKTIVENPREEIVDVEMINADLTNLIIESVETIRKGERNTDLILIQGEPGLGKTHFLSRMRKKAKDHNYLFVDLPPLGDISRIYSHILQQLFINLNWKGPQERYSPLYHLIAQVLSAVLVEKLKENVIKEDTKQVVIKLKEDPTLIFEYFKALENRKQVRDSIIAQAIFFLMERNPNIDQLFLEVLFKLTDLSEQLLALKWLKGYDLSDDDLKRLNVKESISNDEIANRILHSLLMITDRPILFCLDQLESVSVRFAAENGIKILFDTLTNIYNRYQNICMLLMCQSHVWTEIEKVIEKSALDRIQTKRSLAKLSVEEGILLVESRFKLIYPSPMRLPYSTYPFSHEFLRQVLKEVGYNPRELLKRISREFEFMQSRNTILERHPEIEGKIEVPPAPTREVEPLHTFLDRELESIRKDIVQTSKDFYTYPVRQNFIHGILYEILREISSRQMKIQGFQIIDLQINQKVSKKDLDILLTLERAGASYRIGIETNNSENMTSLYHVFRRLLDEMQKLKLTRVFLLRDAALPISPSAKKTNELLQELEKQGTLILLPEEDTLELMSIKKLLEKTSAGDLMHGTTVITRNEVLQYLLPDKILKVTSIVRVFETLESMKASIPLEKGAKPGIQIPVTTKIPKTAEIMETQAKSTPEPHRPLIEPKLPSNSMKGTTDNLEDLFADFPNLFPSAGPSEPPQKPQVPEKAAPLQEVNLKGSILQLIRKQAFYTLKKLKESFLTIDMIQIREILQMMAKEQMIYIICDRGDDYIFAIHPTYL